MEMNKMLYKWSILLFSALSVFCVKGQNIDSTRVIRGPYLQMATQHSIIVRWRTDLPAVSELYYGPDSSLLSNHITLKSEPTTEHEIEIPNLKADTRHYYSIGSQKGSNVSYFETLPDVMQAGEYTFLALGDCGSGYQQQTDVKNAVLEEFGNHFDGVLLLGDNAYQSGTDKNYQDNFFRYNEIFTNSVIWPTPGNHDYNNHIPFSVDPAYYDIFNCPTEGECGGVPSGSEKYYSYDFGNIHFISIDSYDESTKESGAMVSWLKKDLEQNSQQWTIVYWHHPPYSKGSHDSDNGLFNRKMIQMRKRIVPLLENSNVDLVLNGHSHTYERSKLISGHYGKSRTLEESNIIDSTGGVYPEHCPYDKSDSSVNKGTVYCVMGTSGKISKVNKDWPHPVMYSYDDKNVGALILQINGSELNVKYLTSHKEISDHFTISKGEISCE